MKNFEKQQHPFIHSLQSSPKASLKQLFYQFFFKNLFTFFVLLPNKQKETKRREKRPRIETKEEEEEEENWS